MEHYSINQLNEKVRLLDAQCDANSGVIELLFQRLDRQDKRLSEMQKQIDRLNGVHGA